MITLFQIDKSGNEIFEKDYSIAVIVNRNEVYGINLVQNIKDSLLGLLYSGQLETKSETKKIDKTRFRIRVHTSVIILLLKKIMESNKNIKEINIQICNDIDGHFHEIREMIFAHLSKINSFLKKEDIVQTKFPKTSLVVLAAKNIRKHSQEIKNYNLIKLTLEELIQIIKR